MMFTNLKLSRWRQFNDVNIILDDRMTILTGENGTGKTTILNILSKHFGWNLHLISTPLPISKSRKKRIWSDIWEMYDSSQPIKSGSSEIGRVNFEDGSECQLSAPPKISQAQYNLTYSNKKNLPGLHIPSHRPAFAYQRVDNIPTNPKTSQEQYQEYQNLLFQLYQNVHSNNPGTALKQSLMSLAVFGHGSEVVAENPEYKKLFKGFQEVLRILFPKSIGFRKIEIRVPDIVFITDSGDFSLDAASGGLGALVGIAWQIYMYGKEKDKYVVTIDEPESHLHPSMQREIIPNLFRAFPNSQFIIATHSPFIVTSLPEAKVYALTYNEERRVDSLYLETSDLSGTANETLREILGVPISVPIWVEQKLIEIVDRYKAKELTSELLVSLKKELIKENLGSLLPDALSKIGGWNA